ncbi:hypothetical protein LCGC14_2707200 [marine sediment metagenome]|uniref:Uncharacterized protein n=1 Tax=marine sediment metagenome TaxID=412755 RepID=A0A0F9C5U0_9ZZZZ
MTKSQRDNLGHPNFGSVPSSHFCNHVRRGVPFLSPRRSRPRPGFGLPPRQLDLPGVDYSRGPYRVEHRGEPWLP